MTATIQAQGVLLDIEGTTSSISFVHDVLFPYALQRVDDFLASNFDRDDVQAACEQIAADAGFPSLDALRAASNAESLHQAVADEVRRQTAADMKATGLKTLQGLIWHGGFHSGELQAHVFPDVVPTLQRWRAAGIPIRIYSSGSVAAQKMFFGHLQSWGDCLNLLDGHYDTTTGGKKETTSYRRIAADWGLPPHEVLFISDVPGELLAAQEAGLQVLASVRPGNAPLPDALPVPQITSFEQINLVRA